MLRRALLTLPRARRWVQQTIDEHQAIARPLRSMGFDSLARWYSLTLLDQVQVAVVERMPRLPLEEWGFPEGHDLTPVNPAGLALRDMVFIKQGSERNASLMFHELVHVVQWRVLGPGRFIAFYGLELIERGYADHRLEIMARELQSEFDDGTAPFDLEALAARRTQADVERFRGETWNHRVAMVLAGR